MAEGKKPLNYGFIFSVAVTLAGACVTYGVLTQKVETQADNVARIEKEYKTNDAQIMAQVEKDLKVLRDKQSNSDALLQSINTQLVELNTKTTLLLNGDIKTKSKE